MFNIFQKQHKQIFKAIALVATLAVFFVSAKSAMASAGDAVAGAAYFGVGTIGAAVSYVLGLIALILTTVIGLLITLVVAVLIQVAQYGNIINVPTVVQGWVIVRDLCNMSFILILLIIAFATILRQENFSAKKLLPKLLIMAVLINFSRTIFGLLIDFSQIIMLTFVNAFAAGGGWFIQAFNTNFLLTINGNFVSSDYAISAWSTAVAIIAGVLAAIITLIVLSVMLAVLVWRIVILWIYTIFSPLVFLGFGFPPLQKYTGKIWEDFTKQLVIGPVLAFFIWLALSTAETSTKSLIAAGQSLSTGVAPEVCAGVGKFFCQGPFQQFIIVIGLLMGGLMIAQEMGGVAGSIAGKGMAAINMGKGLAWKGAKKLASGDNYLARKVAKGIGWDFRPIKLAEAWKAHSESSKRKDESAIRQKSREHFEAGGMQSVLMGMGGEDYFNKYTEGFMAHKGIRRAWKEAFVSPKRREKLGRQIDINDKAIENLEEQKANAIADPLIKNAMELKRQTDISYDPEIDRIVREITATEARFNALKRKPKNTLTSDEEQELADLKEKKDGLKEEKAQREQVVSRESKEDYIKHNPSLNSFEKSLEKRQEFGKRLKEQIMQHQSPVGLQARSLYRKDVEEAKAKYKSITNADELVKAFNDAEQRGDKFDMAALFEKLENDTNGNELLRSRGYSSTGKGVKAFLDNEVNDYGEHNKGLKGAKFSPDERLQIQSDYAEAAQHVGHWDMAKLVGTNSKGEMESLVRAIKDNTGAIKRDALGRAQYNDMDHATAAYAEVIKMDPQKIVNSLNRLAMGGEDGKGQYQIANLGKMIYRNLASGGVFEAQKSRVLSNLAANLSSPNVLPVLKEIMKDDSRKGDIQIRVLTSRGLANKGGGKPGDMAAYMRTNGLVT